MSYDFKATVKESIVAYDSLAEDGHRSVRNAFNIKLISAFFRSIRRPKHPVSA